MWRACSGLSCLDILFSMVSLEPLTQLWNPPRSAASAASLPCQHRWARAGSASALGSLRGLSCQPPGPLGQASAAAPAGCVLSLVRGLNCPHQDSLQALKCPGPVPILALILAPHVHSVQDPEVSSQPPYHTVWSLNKVVSTLRALFSHLTPEASRLMAVFANVDGEEGSLSELNRNLSTTLLCQLLPEE